MKESTNETKNKKETKYDLPEDEDEENKDKMDQQLNENREKLRKMEDFYEGIAKKTTNCHELSEKIESQKKELKYLNNEIKIRKRHFNESNKNYKALIGEGTEGDDEKKVEEIKKMIIRERLDDVLDRKMPEAKLKPNEGRIRNDIEENEFRDLIYDSIQVIYTKYESDINKNPIEDIKNFKISNHSKFSSLKKEACLYFCIKEPDDYTFTDEVESIIYNENMKVNDYMKYYSLKSNKIRIMKKGVLAERDKLLPAQEFKVEELNSKKKNQKEGSRRGVGEGGKAIIKEFYMRYPGLRPYSIENLSFKDGEEQVQSVNPENLDTSFIMIILFLALLILTIIFIYRSDNDTNLDYSRMTYLLKTFNTDEVHDLDTLPEYMIQTLFLGLLKNVEKFDNSSAPNVTELLNSLCSKNDPNSNIRLFRDICSDTSPQTLRKIQEVFDGSNVPSGFYTLSSLHIIVEKVKKRDCLDRKSVKSLISGECYYDYYNEDNRREENLDSMDEIANNFKGDILKMEDDIITLLQNFREYKTSTQSKIKLGFNTIGGHFDGSGFHIDIPFTYKHIFHYINFVSALIPLNKEDDYSKYEMVNKDVRGITFVFNTYFQSNERTMANVLIVSKIFFYFCFISFL